VFVSLRIREGRLGRAWLAIREDELAASMMGVPLMRTKLAAYAVGAFAGGLGGVAYASHTGAVSIDTFRFSVSIILLAMVVLGGMGNVWGVMIGALVLSWINSTGMSELGESVNGALGTNIDFPSYNFLIFGVLLVLMMLFRREGLDSIVEVLTADGRAVPRAVLRSLAQTEIALNDPDSGRRSIRLAAWNEIATNDYLLIGDELLQVEAMPTHPDDDIRLKGFRGPRTPLLDTSARNHSVGAAVYKVEIHPPGTRLEPNGMPIAQIDYVNDDGGPRFGGKDSRLHFEAPADGEYFVRLRDVRGLEGERFTYRLTVREPAPDFTVTFDPKSFNVPRGGRVSVTVTADRRDGFDGPIDVEFRDMPAGLTATAGRIPAGADTTVLMLAAAESASLETLPTLQLVGRATIDGRPVTRDADITEPIPVVALAPKPDLVVTTGAQQLEVAAGQEVTLTVSVERHNGFTARVPISVMNLPHGVRVNDVGLNGVMITEQETTRTIHIVAEPWVQPQTQPILIVGRVEVNSPLRNEAAALPVQLTIKPAVTTAVSRQD
jgi:hypothetical protein